MENQENVSMEIEAIVAIYLDDIQVIYNDDSSVDHLIVDLLPLTADNRTEQYVKMSLKIALSKEYPNKVPGFTIISSRGLCDKTIEKIIDNLDKFVGELIGTSMLFDVIERAKEILTENNFPSGKCPLCLNEFVVGDEFEKTICFHYIHSRCLAEYAQYILFEIQMRIKKRTFIDLDDEFDEEKLMKKLSICPICRCEIDLKGLEHPEKYKAPCLSGESSDEEIIEEAKQKIKEYNDLYQKQLKQGGIINREEEMNRFFISISNVETLPLDVSNQNQTVSTQTSQTRIIPVFDSDTQ